ncbi:hypothetical protein [Serratia rhizosphaerae]|uniref:hypothetical protein n=1 Tax=Serratia rhizosphaerae TaxID=2597702 RepID=UPI002DBC4741|nr:hypothetical protein [Serratia rhizosphaerae]MEB6337735.1 hypothetical protein [Serratia rhizosphaerae]
MKKVFLTLAKVAVFIILLMNMGIWFPYYYFIRVNMHHIMSLGAARDITDIFGGYPEPYDFMALLIVLILNVIISIICCKLIFMLGSYLKKLITSSN